MVRLPGSCDQSPSSRIRTQHVSALTQISRSRREIALLGHRREATHIPVARSLGGTANKFFSDVLLLITGMHRDVNQKTIAFPRPKLRSRTRRVRDIGATFRIGSESRASARVDGKRRGSRRRCRNSHEARASFLQMNGPSFPLADRLTGSLNELVG